MISWISVVAAALMLSEPGPADRARLDSLADATAASTTRFADRRVAIAEGYRRIGTDFPSMGEHWVLPSALLGRQLDPARPTVLAYATIDGRATLIGTGFIITTRGSASADVPGWPTYWHEHSGALSDESGAHVGMSDPSPDATHVWVLHIWTALPNPLGRYDSDNWALPFARLGLSPPSDVDHDMGRALSLSVAEGDTYLRRILEDAGLRTEQNHVRVDAALETARAATAATAARVRLAGVVSPDDGQSLRASWQGLSVALREVLGPAVDPILAPPHRHH
jgi:hypothetical protein